MDITQSFAGINVTNTLNLQEKRAIECKMGHFELFQSNAEIETLPRTSFGFLKILRRQNIVLPNISAGCWLWPQIRWLD